MLSEGTQDNTAMKKIMLKAKNTLWANKEIDAVAKKCKCRRDMLRKHAHTHAHTHTHTGKRRFQNILNIGPEDKSTYQCV